MRLRKAREVLATLPLFALSLLFLHPILWLADSAFRQPVDIFSVPPLLVRDPVAAIQRYTLGGFTQAFERWGIGRALLVSVVVTTLALALTLLVCSLCAYAIAFLEYPGRDAMFFGVLALMMLPMATMIIPTFETLRFLHLTDNLLGLVLPYALSPMGVFLLRQFYVKIPRQLFEGCTPCRSGSR